MQWDTTFCFVFLHLLESAQTEFCKWTRTFSVLFFRLESWVFVTRCNKIVEISTVKRVLLQWIRVSLTYVYNTILYFKKLKGRRNKNEIEYCSLFCYIQYRANIFQRLTKCRSFSAWRSILQFWRGKGHLVQFWVCHFCSCFHFLPQLLVDKLVTLIPQDLNRYIAFGEVDRINWTKNMWVP